MSFDVTNQHVVVAGGGRSGVAAAELLLSRGARVTLSDLREPDGADDLRRRGATVDVGPHRAGAVCRAPIWSCSVRACRRIRKRCAAARRAGVPVMGEVETGVALAHGPRDCDHGHEGQVDDDDAHRAHAAGGGLRRDGRRQSRHGAVDAGRRPRIRGALHVVEVSSFQLETTDTFHPWIAVLLNLSPDHLDRHPTFEAYAAAKARVFANQTADDWAVVNADDAPSMALAAGGRARRFDFALDAGSSPTASPCATATSCGAMAAGPRRCCRCRRCGCRAGICWATCWPRPRWAASPACRRRRCGAPSRASPACRTRSNAWPRSAA